MIEARQHVSDDNSPKFSVLMSIYHKEDPAYFERAMQSIWDDQKIKPNEIVLVEDGLLTNELYEIINLWKVKIGSIFQIKSLKKNMGVGYALNIGLKICKYDLIARMDTDDVSLPDRFKKQLSVFQQHNIDICGSWINEFEDLEDAIEVVRKLPEYHQNIINFAKFRSPMNHVSIMFKKDVVINAGGYQELMWLEDYYLFVRLIQSGAKFYNIQESLVNVLAGANQLERRRGLKYAISEFDLQKRMLKLGFLSRLEFFLNITTKFILRMMPKKVFYFIYAEIRKH
jgi:glycosyltransferase involved in cell wall biosynthesis